MGDQNQPLEVEHLVLGPLDPIDDDLNHARGLLDDMRGSPDIMANFVISLVRHYLDEAADAGPDVAARLIRRSRAVLAMHAEAVES